MLKIITCITCHLKFSHIFVAYEQIDECILKGNKKYLIPYFLDKK